MIAIFTLACFATIAATHGWFLWRFMKSDRRFRKEEAEFVARLQADQVRLNTFMTDLKARRRAEDPRA